MVTEAKTTNYWISNSALYIQLNATGEPNRIQASVVSGASILCYMQGIDGLGYDAGHNYQRWTLAAYPSEFPSDEKRYVYVAIPRKRTSGNDIATIVFPSQKIDIYGKAIVLNTDEDGKQEEVVGDQIGSEDYYYIYLQGVISEVYLNNANDRVRRWVQDVDFGSLSTDEALASGGVAQWWKYNSVSDTVTFLKTIFSATFDSLVAKTISIKELFFGKKKITGIASDQSQEDSEEEIVTPKYLKKYGGGKYLSKVTDDTANGLINFAKGLLIKGFGDLATGSVSGYSAKITELGDAFFRAIKSLDYDNAAEQGFSVEKEKNGKYHAFFTNLTIWGKAIFHELEIRKLSYSGGNIYLSGAGSKLIKVVPVKQSVSNGVTTWVEMTKDDAESECAGWKCYLLADDGTTAAMNYWQEGDQVRCQTMGEIVSGGTYQNVSNKSYWRTIPDGGVSTQNEKIYGTKTETYLDEDGNEQTRPVQVELYDGQAFAWIVIGKHCRDIDGYDDEFSVDDNGSNPAPLETRDIPSAGDTIVLDGNRHRDENTGKYDKTDRQNVIILETTGEYAPRIACYANITEYKHTFTKSVNGSDKEVSLSVFETSPKGGTKINSSRFEWISDDGSTINIINYRGDWIKDNTYHKNDQVNHNNAVWVCVANSGVDVTAEPSDGEQNWKKVLSGEKGEKGDKGDDGLSGNGIVPVYTRSEGTPTPPTSTDKNNLDNGWSLTIPSVADVENVSYSDSAWTDYNDGVHTWKKSPTTADSYTSSCLVTFTTTKENQVVKFVIKSFSEPRYDYIFLSEIDATSVPSRPTSNGRSRAVSGNGVELSITDVVATAGTHTVYVCYGKDNSGSFHGDYGLFRIEKMTDIDIPLWQSNGKEVSTRDDSGAIKREIESWSEPFKVTGENGTDAVSYTVTLTRGSNGTTQGLYVGVTRYIGTACTTGTIIDFGMSCKAYTDGTFAQGLTDRLQTSDDYIDFAAFPTAKSFTVELLDKNGNKVATGNYSSGDDAISILVEDAPLVFDTADNGIVPDDVTKKAKVKVMRGNTNVTNDCNQESSRDDLSSNCGSVVTKKNGYIEVSVSGGYIVKNDIIVDGVNQGKVSTTSGYAVAQFVYDSVTYFAQVPFSVNVAKFTGSVSFDNKRYKVQFDELSNGGGAATKDELKDVTSTFEQTAREISLSVSEKSIGRRNMLVGSAFLREDNNRIISNDARIEINSGYQGTNCIHVIDATEAGNPHYVGVYWDGSQGGRSVKIEKGKKYTISCYYKTNDSNAKFSLEAIYTDKETNAERLGRPKYLSPSSFNPKYNQWELFTTVIDTTDAESDYIAFNFWEYCDVNAGRINAYICRPMVEEGDKYNGWTLSQDDYDIIGANLIDNSRTLDTGGNVIEAKGQKALVGDVYELTYIGSDDYNTFYRIKGSTFKLNTDYTISFEVRGDAKYMGVYAYYPITNTKFTFYAEPQNGAMTEVTDGGKVDNYVALIQVKELSKQQRVWSHFRFKDRLPDHIYFRFPKNAEQTGVTSWSVTITRPKIEVGAVVTEYTERKSDLIDKASLKKAGIEVKSDEVLLYGDRIRVDNNGQTAAMFIGGKLNADFIDADKIEVKHLWAKSEDGTVKVGYFGNTEESACKINDNTFAPLFVGGVTAKDSPFYVTSEGAMHATSGYIGGFTILSNRLHSDGSGYSFDIYNDRLAYTDNTNQRTLLISSDSDDGLQLSLTAAEENMSCKLMVGKQDGVGNVIGLLTAKTRYEGRYTQNGLRFGRILGGHYVDVWVTNGKTGHIVTPTAGIVCYINETYDETTLILKGLPTKKPTSGSVGEIYVENGILKMFTGNF